MMMTFPLVRTETRPGLDNTKQTPAHRPVLAPVRCAFGVPALGVRLRGWLGFRVMGMEPRAALALWWERLLGPFPSKAELGRQIGQLAV